jgi:hypothetical protein
LRHSGIFEDVDNSIREKRFILQGGRLEAATVNIILIQFTPSQSLLDFKYYRATRLLSLSVYHNCINPGNVDKL